jgi:hypothetical protein
LLTETENGLTRAVTLIALTCLLVAGVAAASILGRDSVPEASSSGPSPIAQNPVSNREAKNDKLAVATATPESANLSANPPADLNVTLRQAFAAQNPADVTPPQLAAPPSVVPPSITPPPAATSTPQVAKLEPPKLPAKPAPQKSYALLSDAQIAGIKDRLNLSPDQQSYWPAVESALRAVARKIHANKLADPHAATPIDPDSDEVSQLKSAAMPLLFQLREDQKREVRSLARLIGLEKVAAQI